MHCTEFRDCTAAWTHRPVVVEVAQLVGEPLHVVGFEATGVTDDVEVGRSDRPLTHTLTRQEEIIPTHTTPTHMSTQTATCTCTYTHMHAHTREKSERTTQFPAQLHNSPQLKKFTSMKVVSSEQRVVYPLLSGFLVPGKDAKT